jgi:hypothetical protein
MVANRIEAPRPVIHEKNKDLSPEKAVLSIETLAAVGTMLVPATSNKDKEAAWSFVAQKFLHGKSNTSDGAEGAEAVKRLMLLGDKPTLKRAVDLLAEGLRKGDVRDNRAADVSLTVLINGPVTFPSSDDPRPFVDVLDMLYDTVLNGTGSAIAQNANWTARRKAARTLVAALEHCSNDPYKVKDELITQRLVGALETGDAWARSAVKDTLEDAKKDFNEATTKLIRTHLEYSREEMLRSVKRPII